MFIFLSIYLGNMYHPRFHPNYPNYNQKLIQSGNIFCIRYQKINKKYHRSRNCFIRNYSKSQVSLETVEKYY